MRPYSLLPYIFQIRYLLQPQDSLKSDHGYMVLQYNLKPSDLTDISSAGLIM